MPRFFIEPGEICSGTVRLTGESAHHLGKVLRIKIGDELTLCDGQGTDYHTKIEQITKDEVHASVLSSKASDTEPGVAVTLFQGLPKSDKMETIIQKCTELGICKIIPCIMDRCVVKLDGEREMQKKVVRWQKVANEAAKQSGRGILPKVELPVRFGQALRQLAECDLAFSAYEGERETGLKKVLAGASKPDTVGYMIGPEGGFSDGEVSRLRQAGIKIVTLGKRILRTETAGSAVLAMIMYELEERNS